MCSIRLTVLLCAVFATGVDAKPAQPLLTTTTDDVFPASVASYATSELLTRTHANSAAMTLDGSELFTHVNAYDEGVAGSGGSPSYLPLLYSAIIPGAGEIALGHWVRGGLMVALEVIAWTGYAKYDGDGVDMRTQYESFADDHWTIRKWVDDHKEVYPAFSNQGWQPAQMDSIGRVVSGSGTWPGYIPWVSKEEDSQHFYENIGKYDWYISGWEDYNPATTPQQMDTDMRDQYRNMRIESDDNFDTAKRFVYLSVATRVTSVLQTVYLIRKKASSDVEESRVGVRARAYGLSGGEVALEYRFK